jgi:hypothetical protein
MSTTRDLASSRCHASPPPLSLPAGTPLPPAVPATAAATAADLELELEPGVLPVLAEH